MSLLRLLLTSAAMAVVADVLGTLTPPAAEIVDALSHPQSTVDTAGADALVLAAAGAAAWLVWAWGVLGLTLTALSAAPGTLGRTADIVVGRLLPAGARRTAALALGLSLGVTAPVLGWAGSIQPAYAAPPAAGPTVPDWPAVPDAPPEAPADDRAHVVLRGDCLWDIAADRLRSVGATPTDGEIAVAVQGWWSANAAVIGPDPDLILPGQVLQDPHSAPHDPSEEPR